MAFKNGDQHCDVGPLCPLQFYRAAVSHTVSITDTDSIAWAMCGSREVNMLHCHRHRDAFDQLVVPEDMRLIRVLGAIYVHGSRCVIYGYLVRAGIHGSHKVVACATYRSTGYLHRRHLNLTFINQYC